MKKLTCNDHKIIIGHLNSQSYDKVRRKCDDFMIITIFEKRVSEIVIYTKEFQLSVTHIMNGQRDHE